MRNLVTGTRTKPRFILLGLLISILLSLGGLIYYQYEKNLLVVDLAIIIVILLFLTLLATGYLYISHQRNYYKELFIKEKDLRTAQQEFKTTLYSIGEAIITVTTTGKIKHMNPIAEILTGWNEDESVGRPLEDVFQIINEVTRERAENPVRKVLKNGIVTGLTNHTLLISREGRKIPISESGAPIKNEEGEVLGVVLGFRDQTEARLAQKSIEESRQRFLSLYENMNEGVAMHELVVGKNNKLINYRIVDVNPQFEKILDLNREEVIGKTATEIYKTEQAPYLKEYSNVALTGVPYTFETYYEPMGKYFHISVTKWSNNGFTTIFMDITERRRIEEALNKRVIALTQPMGKAVDITFTELFSIEDIQQLQDSFSNATGVASIITDTNGTPLTKPSNFCKLCNEIIRMTPAGLANCIHSDSVIGCYHPEGAIVQPCLSGGLWDAGASIMVGEKHIANWLIGQVRNEKTDETSILKYADVIGANKEDFEKALSEVPVMSEERFRIIADALFSFANELSLKAYQNIQQARFIAEREIIEEELRLREENLSITLNSIGDAVISTDTKGYVTGMNAVASFLTGWNKEEALGLHLSVIFKIINAKTRAEVTNPVARVIKEGIIVGLANHTVLISKDGTQRQISDSAAPIKSKDGNIHGVVLVFSDVTKEYNIYKTLENSERFLKESQLAGRIGSYMTDLKTNIWTSSEALDIIFGIDKSYNKSTSGWVSIVHPEWQQELSDYLVDEVLGKKQRFDKEYVIVRKNDGEERWVHGVGELEFDEEGTPIKMIGTIQDITEKVKAKQELELYKNHLEELIAARTADLDKANGQLLGEIQKAKEYEMMLQASLKNEQSLNEFKSRFISTTSHEFRTPLTSILSSSELIKRYGRNWEQTKVDEHLDRIKYSVDHLTNLLDDVQTINRTDNGKINYNPQLINLRALCDEIIVEAESHSKSSHNFIFKYKTEKNNFILDRKLIRFMLLNLLSNAFKYSPDGGDVVLEISADGNNLKLRIEDCGLGIPEEDRKHLFEPFHRGNNVNNIPGTGLGLSIVKKSVEIHSGQIKYNSVLGQGTNFTITIPGGNYEEENINN